MSRKKKTKAFAHQPQHETQLQKHPKQESQIAHPEQEPLGYFTADRTAPLGSSVDSSVDILRHVDLNQRYEMLDKLSHLQTNSHVMRIIQRLQAVESAESERDRPTNASELRATEARLQRQWRPEPNVDTRSQFEIVRAQNSWMFGADGKPLSNPFESANTTANKPTVNRTPQRVDSRPHTPTIQAKLTVNEVNDPFEQEADRVADEVMRMPAVDVAPPPADAPPSEPPSDGISPTDGNNQSLGPQFLLPFAQRSAENDPIGGTTVDDDVERRVDKLKGKGEPLSDDSREFFESRMGADFSGVRIHRDASSNQLSRDLNARAFTVGNNIAFSSGEYNPDTPDGKRLLAHELTHTVQQGGAEHVSRKEAAQIEAEARAEENLKQAGAKASTSKDEPDETVSPESVGPSSAQDELDAASKPPVQPTDLNNIQGDEADGGEEAPQLAESGGEEPEVEEAEELEVEGEDVDIELPPEAATIVAEGGIKGTSEDEAAASESVGGEAIPTADGGGTVPELPPAPPVPEVASAEPAQALSAVSNLMPVDLLQGIGEVTGSVGTFVKKKEDELAASPPQMERPSGAEAKREQPGEPVQPPDAPPPVPVVQTPAGTDVPAPPPKPEPTPPPPAARNAPAPSGPDDVEAAVGNIPTTDRGVNTNPGEPPKVMLDGNADPNQVSDQATKLHSSTSQTFTAGQQEAQLPMGEREVYPVVPSEILKAELPEGGDAAAAIASAEAAVAGAASFEDPDAISIIAQEEQGTEIEAALATAQSDIAAQQVEHEAAIQAEQDKSRQEIDQLVSDNKAQQDELRAQTLGEVEGMRAEWSAEQTQLVTDAQQESMQLQQSGHAEIQQEFAQANVEASQHIDEGRQKAEAAQQEGEQKAESEKEKGEGESGGFFGKLFSAAADFFNKVKKAVTAVLEAAQKAIKAAIDLAKKLATAVIEAARKAIVAVIQRIGDALIAIGDKLLAAFPELNERFKTLIQDAVNRATQAVNELADQLKEGVQKALDALAEGLSAALNLLQQGLMFVIDAVHNKVKDAIDAAKAIVDTLGTFAALIKDIAANPGQWLSNLGAAIKDGIVNHLWSAFQTKVKEWFNSKLEEVLGLGLTVWNVLKEGGFDLAKIGKMAWDALVDAIPSALMQILIEKLVAMIVPAAGAIMVIIEGLQAAWGTVQRIIQAIDAFVSFLKMVKSGNAGPAFANVLAMAAIVVIDFVSNWLLTKLKAAGKAIAGKLKKIAARLFGKGKNKRKAKNKPSTPSKNIDDADGTPSSKHKKDDDDEQKFDHGLSGRGYKPNSNERTTTREQHKLASSQARSKDMTEDEFVNAYKSRNKSTTKSDEELRDWHKKGKRLNPETGRAGDPDNWKSPIPKDPGTQKRHIVAKDVFKEHLDGKSYKERKKYLNDKGYEVKNKSQYEKAKKKYLKDMNKDTDNIWDGPGSENMSKGRKSAHSKRKMKDAIKNGDQKAYEQHRDEWKKNVLDVNPDDPSAVKYQDILDETVQQYDRQFAESAKDKLKNNKSSGSKLK